MKNYTFSQLLDIMERAGNNLAYLAVGRWMDAVELQTGIFPDWDSFAPEWAVKLVFGDKGGALS